jgi:hypothetical protein
VSLATHRGIPPSLHATRNATMTQATPLRKRDRLRQFLSPGGSTRGSSQNLPASPATSTSQPKSSGTSTVTQRDFQDRVFLLLSQQNQRHHPTTYRAEYDRCQYGPGASPHRDETEAENMPIEEIDLCILRTHGYLTREGRQYYEIVRSVKASRRYCLQRRPYTY